MRAVRNPGDFWSGALFVATGSLFLLFSRGLDFGTPLRMGPSFFPIVLSILLVGIGLAIMARGLVTDGAAVQGIALKALALIAGGGILFGLLVRDGGLIVAVSALTLVTAAASEKFKWYTALAMAIVLSAFCAVVFVWGLGVSIPIVGSWFIE